MLDNSSTDKAETVIEMKTRWNYEIGEIRE